MSVPTVPSLHGMSVEQGLLATVAIEEAALAHLVNAEAEKVQRLAGDMPAPSTFAEALDMQKTVLAVLNVLVLKEMLLLDKVKTVARLPVPRNCPKSYRFWRAHPDSWPVNSLNLGCENYDREELLLLLDTPSAGNASLTLARQLIAAKLSIANGSDGSSISSAVQEADELLCEFCGKLPYSHVKPGMRRQMLSLAHQIKGFNLGYLTHGCKPWE